MWKIYIARHGQDEDNFNWILNWHRDMPLTEVWLFQARELSRMIRENSITFDKVFSSPLKRAYHTWLEVTNWLSIEKPEILDLLIERDFWIMTWKKVCDIEKLCSPEIIKAEKITYFLNPEWWEDFPLLLWRTRKILDILVKNYSDKNILLVTHWDTWKMIYSHFYWLDWLECLTWFHFWNSELILLEKWLEESKRHIFKTKQFNH